jgi:hypothetical protein
MHRRRLAAALLAGIAAAALAALGMRTADAGTAQPPPEYYPLCAVGGFESAVATGPSGGPRLTVTGWAGLCGDQIMAPYFMAFEVRYYQPDGSFLVHRAPFTSWTGSTPFSDTVDAVDGTTLCLVWGGGADRRLQCVRFAGTADPASWHAVPLPVDDPSLNVTDYKLLPPKTQEPRPNCGHCT